MESSIMEELQLRRLITNDYNKQRERLEILKEQKDVDVFYKICKEEMDRDYNMLKKFCMDNEFVCEICGKIKQKHLEGADMNTCRDCNPERVEYDDDAE